MTTLDERIATLEALDKDRSQGAWSFRESGHCGGAVYRVSPQFTDRGGMSREDAAFIAAAPEMMSVIRELKAERDERKWQPIETAPKDGTKIVVAEYEDGGVHPQDSRWVFWTDYWREYLPPHGEGFGRPAKPTHWMPLPEKPK